MRSILEMKQPAHSELQMWKTALPIGDGITGGLVYGAIAEETVVVTRHDMWQNCKNNAPLPDITPAFRETRRLLDEGDYLPATMVMQNALADAGYAPSTPCPIPLGMLHLYAQYNTGEFRSYRRGIEMDKAIAYVRYRLFGEEYLRETFVSHDDGVLYSRIRSGGEQGYTLFFGPCDHHDSRSYHALQKLLPTVRYCSGEDSLCCTAAYDGTDCGAVLKVVCHVPGKVSCDTDTNTLRVDCQDFSIRLLTFTHACPDDWQSRLSRDYGEALDAHIRAYTAVFGRMDLTLTDEEDDRSVEELLADAYDGEASPMLCEKLWRYGRYLFVSGSAPQGNPFPLYGLWHGDYDLPWAQHVGNQNVEMLHWHTLTGGLADRLPALIHYYFQKMDSFRENARKLFGCGGIYVPAYTFPKTLNGEDIAPPVPPVSVVLNWISCAGWLSYHFFQYYQYTGDKALLLSEILPFMLEAARFYCDYVSRDEDGTVKFSPSVSPENTPASLLGIETRGCVYLNSPVVENATMDFALLKALLTNLLSLEGEVSLPEADTALWRELLALIPAYQVNGEGALKEWMHPDFTDNYQHRHFSHLFPLFPGDEIDPDGNSPLLKAAAKAVSLRQSDSQSGWSFAHSACLQARLGNGNGVLKSIDRLSRSCLLDNLFTTHNDWRHMGVSLFMDDMAPVQLDALLGMTNAIQELLFRWRDGDLRLLPALPARFRKVSVTNAHFPGGRVSFDFDGFTLRYRVEADRPLTLRLATPIGSRQVNARPGQPDSGWICCVPLPH